MVHISSTDSEASQTNFTLDAWSLDSSMHQVFGEVGFGWFT
jgi:hypothetical protein